MPPRPTSRQTVHATLKRWAEEEFAGMPDKSRAPHRRGTKVTLRAIATVKELQKNPLLGPAPLSLLDRSPSSVGGGMLNRKGSAATPSSGRLAGR